MYEIEKTHPIPDGRQVKYPFRTMDIGDSFIVPDDAHEVKILRAAAHAASKRYPGKKFKTLTVAGGCRCWRIA